MRYEQSSFHTHSHNSAAEETLNLHPIYFAREVDTSMQFEPGSPVNFFLLLRHDGARASKIDIVSGMHSVAVELETYSQTPIVKSCSIPGVTLAMNFKNTMRYWSTRIATSSGCC